MIISRKVFITTMFVLSLFLVKAESIKDSLRIVEIKEDQLTSVIDSIIILESECTYYNPKLIYSVDIQHSENGVINVKIGSLGYDIVKSESNLGCFTNKGHLFIVSGKRLDHSLFTETDKNTQIKYFPNNGMIDGEIIDLTTNDTFSLWMYKYISGNLVFENRHSIYCE